MTRRLRMYFELARWFCACVTWFFTVGVFVLFGWRALLLSLAATLTGASAIAIAATIRHFEERS